MSDFRNIKPEQLALVIKSGSLNSLPREYQDYYDLMDYVRGLAAKNSHNGKILTKTGIIKLLKTKTGATDYQCRILYDDAINFFHSSLAVKIEAFANMYADQLDDAAAMALNMGNFDSFKDLKKEAFAMRLKVQKNDDLQIPEEFYRKQTVIYTTDITDVGGTPEDIKEIERMIDELPEVPVIKKERAKMEAGITQFDVMRMMADDIETFGDEEN